MTKSLFTLVLAYTILNPKLAEAQVPLPSQGVPQVQVPLGATPPQGRRPRRPAQNEPPRFSPPGPGEFDDPAEEDPEFNDPSRRAANPNTPPPPPPPLNDYKPPPSSATMGKTEASKVHFQVVDGIYWEKGKRRGRRSDSLSNSR